jgi:hypothetical protein
MSKSEKSAYFRAFLNNVFNGFEKSMKFYVF